MPRSHAAGLNRRHFVQAALAACAPASAFAQSGYPAHPVTIVVPFPPGGPTDESARLYAKALGERLGQPIVVDNRGGAAGTVGSAYVARQPADGYTLLWGGTSTLAVAPGLYKNLSYDAASFVPIGMALRGPMMIAANPGANLQTLQDMVQQAKTRSLSIATAGLGSIGHLAVELFCETAKVRLVHVPYRGGGPALTDALGGQVQLILDNASELYPYINEGKLRGIAVTSAKPYALTPDVPTVRSLLGGNYEVYSWFGLVAPKGTPEPALQKLDAAMAQAVQSVDIQRELAKMGLEPGMPSAREFGAVIDADYKKWSGIITRANVHVE